MLVVAPQPTNNQQERQEQQQDGSTIIVGVCFVSLHLLASISVLDPLSCPSFSVSSTAAPTRHSPRPPKCLRLSKCPSLANCRNDVECGVQEDRHQDTGCWAKDDSSQRLSIHLHLHRQVQVSWQTKIDPTSHWVLSSPLCNGG